MTVKKTTTVKKQTERCCSFCERKAEQVNRLIAGPKNVFICDECITICMTVLGEDKISPVCPHFPLSTKSYLDILGSELNISPPYRTRVKYDVLYLSADNPQSDKIFKTIVLPIAEKQKVKVKHFSEIINSKLSFDKELLDIYNSTVVIADMNGKNPDIMFFLGMIHLIDKPLVFITQNHDDIPNNLKNNRSIIYKKDQKLNDDIVKFLQSIFLSIKKIKKITKGTTRRKK